MGLFSKKMSPQEFYTACVEDFHKEAMKRGLIKKGPRIIPELLQLGQQAVLIYFKNERLQSQFEDPETYYGFMVMTCIYFGAVFAKKWHEDFSGLSDYAAEMIRVGPYEDAKKLLNKDPGLSGAIYIRWSKMHKPYWSLQDPRNYTFNGMLAAYQLGISIVLESYGY